jgi:hypothetical protein
MNCNKERGCIKKSQEVKIASAKARLVHLQNNGMPFENPIVGLFGGGIKWEEKTSSRIRQILLLPLVIVVCLLMAILIPFMYITHLWDVQKKKQELKKEINELNNYAYDLPQDKTLLSLWFLHGLDAYAFSSDERISLIKDWIDTLYGQAVTNALQIEKRVIDIEESNGEFQRMVHEDKSNLVRCVILQSSVDSLIRNLSEELPCYDLEKM